MYTYITEREREADPIRTRSRTSLLTDIYCAQKCAGRHKSPHSHGVPNLHILRRVLLSISLVLISQSLSQSFLLLLQLSSSCCCLPSFLRATHDFLMTLSLNFLLFLSSLRQDSKPKQELFYVKQMTRLLTRNISEIRVDKWE